MKLVWEGEQKALLPKGESMGSPTLKAVEAVAEEKGVDLSDAHAAAAALVVYNGSMALWGAIYGAVQSRLHPPDALHGLLLGGLVYAANFPSVGVLPKLGVMPPPTMQSMEKAAIPVGAHIAFGLATAAAFEAMN
jgi:hypothetical protein